MIKKPTSIADVRALVEMGAVQDWDALAKEVRLIWDNAKEYNVEGSDIYTMAEKLEASFTIFIPNLVTRALTWSSHSRGRIPKCSHLVHSRVEICDSRYLNQNRRL